jgi:ppGpp synthetase/RelA/SpoT-type nucleotidyltranferase
VVYKARHLIVGFNEGRLRLFEYRQFRGLRFEIQLCSILEHAWNEIEHDRGYKGIYPLSYIESFLYWLKIYRQLTKSSKRLLLNP